MKPYHEWPADPEERRKQARLILGLDIADIRRRGISRALGILSGQVPRGADAHFLELSKWSNGLNEENKRMTLGIVELAVEEALFGLLVTLDGATGGSWIRPEMTAYELVLTVGDGKTVKERLALNLPEDGDMHEDLYPAIEGRPEGL